MTQFLIFRAETMNAGTYQAQAREVPALRQVFIILIRIDIKF